MTAALQDRATVRRVSSLAQADAEIGTGHRIMIQPGTKGCDFVTSNRSVDVLFGPLGSGKTKDMCIRVMRHAQEQWPSPLDALRRTRFAMVRNTTPDLKRSTVRTWLETFPEHVYGRMNFGAPMYHRIRFADVLTEIDFIGLDKPEDVRKLRSTEYTGVCFNELPFIEKDIWDEADSRLRYPSMEHGGPTWRGVLADGNAPDEDHWTAMMFGFVPLPPGLTPREEADLTMPAEWGLHIQPPALIERHDHLGQVIGYDVNPDAENLENLPPDYYKRQLLGKTKAWIDSRLMVRVALVVDGSPVWTQFRREVHVTKEALLPNLKYEVIIGLDFGREPAATFQQAINNRALLQHELIGSNESAVTFAPKVKRLLAEKYPGCKFRAYGDPKGNDKTQTDERTAYQVFAANGIPVFDPPGLKQNMIDTRVQAVDHALIEMDDGIPRVRISPVCKTLIVGGAGRYFNEKGDDGELRPCKNRYSHVCNAWEYAMIGAGEGRRLIGLSPVLQSKPVHYHKKRRTMRRVGA